jgi:hypothetical protein
VTVIDAFEVALPEATLVPNVSPVKIDKKKLIKYDARLDFTSVICPSLTCISYFDSYTIVVL